MKKDTNANNKAMENKTKRAPKTILYCLVSRDGILASDLVSVFLFKEAVFDVFAILVCNNSYKNMGTYIIKPITIAVIAAKNTAPAAISLINPIFS